MTLTIVLFLTSCTQKPEKPQSFSICFAGDLLLDRGVRTNIEMYGVDYLFEDVDSLFQSSDFVIANLECPVTTDSTPINKKYIFRAEPEWLGAVKKSGITHLGMANNHFNDQGRDGAIDTWENIKKYGMTPVGFGNNAKNSCEPVIIEKYGTRVAIFATVTIPLENWFFAENKPGSCQMDIKQLTEKIIAHKKENPDDLIIVFIHWGTEGIETPSSNQRMEARLLIDAGVDAIIGHHPHVIQSVDYIDGKPVFYSIGNFVFDQKKPSMSKGIIPQIFFDDGEISGVVVHSYRIERGKPRLIKKQ
ncbi:MAG: hypothetical protein A2W91_18610 [Bacteroidetes bacterium GWF2_38_335]|nr:MAG: hypothetical protein A2W91_18610 [Bacteroidetes bacterium GWF2_38_335]OFY78183.1 MAG: hypothetical protein A2281_04455 [Bacteroidetes bacterium RIFOXYA12_FULL_38_20]